MPLQKFTDRTAKPLFPLHPAGKSRHISGANCGTRVVDFINQTDLDQIGDKASVIEAFFTFAQAEQQQGRRH